MTLLREVIEVEQEPDVVFEAVSDFSNAAAWDPGVLAARRIHPGSPDPSGVGAAYELTVSFRGRASQMRYTTTRYEHPDVVVLEGVGPQITAVDTIAVEPAAGGGSTIRYTADLRLTGVAKIAEPLLGGAFRRMGRDALAGMQAWLASR